MRAKSLRRLAACSKTLTSFECSTSKKDRAERDVSSYAGISTAYKDTEISARSFFEEEHSKELAALEQAARRKRLVALTY